MPAFEYRQAEEVRDAFRHHKIRSTSFTVRDTTPPSVICPSDIVATNDSGQCSAVVAFAPTVSDNCDSSPTVICAPASGATFAEGTTTVTCTAIDASQNTNACTFTVTVVDGELPSITCPTNRSIPATSPSGATVNSPAPTATDNCSATVVSALAAGASFPIGNTTVTAMAADGTGHTATCTFTVHVQGAEEQLTDLDNLVVSFDLNSRDQRRLLRRVRHAERFFGKDKTNRACRRLAVFRKIVNHKLAKGRLTPDQANQLTLSAGRIRAVLACPRR